MTFPSTERDDRQNRLRSLVERAVGLQAAEWPAFIERAYPGDPALRAEALRLLDERRMAQAEGDFRPVMSAMAPPDATGDHRPSEPSVDHRASIGKYRIVGRFCETSGQADAYLA